MKKIPGYKGAIHIAEDEQVEFINLSTTEISNERYEELVRKEAQLDFLKKIVASKTNFSDITDLKALLDIQ